MTEIGVDGRPTPSTPRADGGDIIFVGDSLVMGVGCSKDTTRPVFSRRIARRVATALQKRMSWSVYGINGADARRMQTLISGMESDIKTRRESGQTAGVRAVVVMCGLNDYKNLVTEGRLPSDFKMDLRRLVNGIHAAVGAEVPVFLPVLPVEQAPAFKDLFPFNVSLAAVASAWDRQKGFLSDEMDHVVFVDSPSTFHSEDWAVDGIHPSEKGYIEWADHIANRMLPVAAVSEVC